MQAVDYPVVYEVTNTTNLEMTLFLELLCEEVILSPGHSVELLAMPSPDLLPLSVEPVEGGLHIHAHMEADPDWHVRFRGQTIRAGYPTRLKDYE